MTTTQDNLGQPLLWSDELLSLVVNVVVFINDNAGQLGTTIMISDEMLSLLSMLSYSLTTTQDNLDNHN